MPHLAISRQLPKKSAQENAIDDTTTEKSTYGTNSLIISVMIVIGLYLLQSDYYLVLLNDILFRFVHNYNFLFGNGWDFNG